MNHEEFAKRYIWPSDREMFLAYCRCWIEPEVLEDLTMADAWRIFALAANAPKPARSNVKLVNRQQPIRAVHIERPMCSNCNAPVSRTGARFCIACTFPAERERRRQARS